MGKAICILMVALCSTGASALGAQPPDETSIRCTLSPATTDASMYFARQNLSLATVRPSVVKDTPNGSAANPEYGVMKVAGVAIPVILASWQNMNKSLLYIDANNDGRLSDEKGYPCRRATGSLGQYVFGPIVLEWGEGQQKVKVELTIGASDPERLVIIPAYSRFGDFRLGKNAYKVAVIDGDLDGTYGKVFSLPPAGVLRPDCDFLAIDLNHDRRFESWTYFQRSELMPLGKFVQLEGAYYSVDVALDGSILELKKAKPECGNLDVNGADVKLKLWSDAGDQYLTGAKKKWELPAGTYSTPAIELNVTDSAKAKWTFYNYVDTGTLRSLQVRAGETTALQLGPPFEIKVSAEKSGQTVSLGLKLQGQAGELYSPAVKRNEAAVAEPKFRIVNEAGKVIASGNFEYG